MALKSKRKVLLWFHAKDLSQKDVAALTEAFVAYDLYFRKVIRDQAKDIFEKFDAVGGEVPQHYAVHARLHGLPIFNSEGERIDVQVNTTGGTVTTSAPAAPTGEIPSPLTAPTSASSAAPAPAPTQSTVAPPPKTN